MKKEADFDFIELIRLLEANRIRYLLIGRWAVILHGAPLMTADYDFWIDPACKDRLLRLLDKKGYEIPPRASWKRPIISVFAGVEKIDLFFFRKIHNAEGQSISFDECLKRAALKEDRAAGISIAVPAIEDLIALKKIPRSSAEEESKDRMDIRFLEELRRTMRNR